MLPLFQPLFYLLLNLFLPQFNLCSASNLEPPFGNHHFNDLQTLGLMPVI